MSNVADEQLALTSEDPKQDKPEEAVDVYTYLRKRAGTPASRMLQQLKEMMTKENLWSEELEAQVPKHWERHGKCVVLPTNCMTSEIWSQTGTKVWEIICSALKVDIVVRKKGAIQNDGCRRPRVDVLYGFPSGGDGRGPWVTKLENGILYSWDIARCMFSSGNISEKQRIATWDCTDQIVIDMFAGIGYFTLTYIMYAKAKFVYAIDWNEDATKALDCNLKQNKVFHKCTIIKGNNEEVTPVNIADHVNLGLIPSSERSWPAACRAISTDRGGILHVHGNVDTKLEGVTPSPTMDCPSSFEDFPAAWIQWAKKVQSKIKKLFEIAYGELGMTWEVEIVGVSKVKSYAPHVDHLVVDIKCIPSPFKRQFAV